MSEHSDGRQCFIHVFIMFYHLDLFCYAFFKTNPPPKKKNKPTIYLMKMADQRASFIAVK